MREWRLSPDLMQLRFSTLQKKNDLTIAISDIARVIIPQQTADIVKVIRGDPEPFNGHVVTLNQKRKNEDYRKKCFEASLFPVSIALNDKRKTRGGRLDLIATSYETFTEWVVGLRWLLSNRSNLRYYAE